MSKIRLLIKGLPEVKFSVEELTKIFRPNCQILSAEVAKSNGGNCRGYGFVEVASEEEAKKILAFSGRKAVQGKTINVERIQDLPKRIKVKCICCGRHFELRELTDKLPRHKPIGSRTTCEGCGEEGTPVSEQTAE